MKLTEEQKLQKQIELTNDVLLPSLQGKAKICLHLTTPDVLLYTKDGGPFPLHEVLKNVRLDQYENGVVVWAEPADCEFSDKSLYK